MKKLEITEKRYIANVTNSIKGGEANKIKYKEMFEKSEPRFCKCCGKQFTYAERTKGTYCSRSCAAKINNKGRIHSLASKEKVRETMKNGLLRSIEYLKYMNANVLFVIPYLCIKSKRQKHVLCNV